MDDEVQRAVALVQGQERTAVERFFEAAVRVSDETQSWAEFRERLGEADVDDVLLREFAERIEREFSDPSLVVAGFARHRPEELLAVYDQAVYDQAGDGGAADGAGGEQAMTRFVTFLGDNEHSWQQTWPESREWVVYTADSQGLGAQSSAFLEYVDATSLNDALVAYGVTPTVEPEEEAATPERAAADAVALGRRAVEKLREQVPDVVVTDEQLIAILDRELNAAGQRG